MMDLKDNLKAKNISLRLSPTAKKILLQDGSYLDWGARPIRRVIQNKVESEISLRFLSGEFVDSGRSISITGNEGDLLFKQIPNKKKQIKKTKIS